MSRLLALLLLLLLCLPAHAQDATATPTFTLKLESNIVLTNVVVRDKKTGALVTGLSAADFTILENGKPQRLASFDYQNVDQAIALRPSAPATLDQRISSIVNADLAADPAQLRNHRLLVLFFDLSSMQPEDVDRAVESATTYVRKTMQPADLVALISYSTGLQLDQDFTADKDALVRTLARYNGTDTQGFTPGGTTGTSEGTADDSSSFTAADSEYAALNTDRELFAIQQVARALERVDARKSMLYFSGGLTRNGIENQASMRAATNAASKANMAIYAVDTRGLQALPPVGDASTGSLRGTAAYSGAAVQSRLAGNFASQETLGTLSSDTGGKAFFDSNDFAPAFQQVERDTEAYYILGFRSSDPTRDGRFRHLTVKVNRPNVRLEYRPGYYAPADFAHSSGGDREQQLADQMRSDLPATDVSVYLEALYFRVPDGRFAVPLSLIVPGSQLVPTADKSKSSLDVLGLVKNAQGITVGSLRETIQLAPADNKADAAAGARRNVQYTSSFELAPGTYHAKFIVRENATGHMGSFETDLYVPDLKKAPIKLSSVVISSQRTPSTGRNAAGPLVRDGLAWVPNIPHVFRTDQHLFLLYELYDPTRLKSAPEPGPAATGALTRRPPLGGVRVLTSIEFLLGGVKVYETPLVEADAINAPATGAVAFQFDVPLEKLAPGTYTCQVNVIDDAGGIFAFPRLALRIAGAGPGANITAK